MLYVTSKLVIEIFYYTSSFMSCFDSLSDSLYTRFLKKKQETFR